MASALVRTDKQRILASSPGRYQAVEFARLPFDTPCGLLGACPEPVERANGRRLIPEDPFVPSRRRRAFPELVEGPHRSSDHGFSHPASSGAWCPSLSFARPPSQNAKPPCPGGFVRFLLMY